VVAGQVIRVVPFEPPATKDQIATRDDVYSQRREQEAAEEADRRQSKERSCQCVLRSFVLEQRRPRR